MIIETTNIKTPIGILQIKGNDEGIASITILKADDKLFETNITSNCLKNCVKQLQAYFYGDLKVFDIPLNPQGTDFQKEVWQQLIQIPFGKTITYQQQSQNFGNTKAIRAIAAANAKNPIMIVIPCHRVVGSDGSLTGYAGGLHNKKWLLEHENAIKQTSLF